MDTEIESRKPKGCGRNPKGCPKRTWRQVMREVLKLMDVEEEEEDRDYWIFRSDCMRSMAKM